MKNILCKIRVMKVQINLFKIRKYFQGLKIRMDFSRKFIHLDGIQVLNKDKFNKKKMSLLKKKEKKSF